MRLSPARLTSSGGGGGGGGSGWTDTFTGTAPNPNWSSTDVGWHNYLDFFFYDSTNGAGSAYSVAHRAGYSHTAVDFSCDLTLNSVVDYPLIGCCYSNDSSYIYLFLNQTTNTIWLREDLAGSEVMNGGAGYDTGVALPGIGVVATYRITIVSGSARAYLNGAQCGVAQAVSGSNTGNDIVLGVNGADKTFFDNAILV